MKRRLAVVAMALVLAACGSTSGSDSGSGGGSGGGTGRVKGGFIQVAQSGREVGPAVVYTSVVSTGFIEVDGVVGLPAFCDGGTEGSCSWTSCGRPDAGTSADAGLTIDSSAGDVTVSGLGVDGGAVTLRWNTTTMKYESFAAANSGPLFTGGETLTASAPGDTVPAFTQTVTAPSRVTVTQPACLSGGCGALDRSTPYRVNWSGGTQGTVTVTLFGNDGTNSIGVSCTATAAAGTLSVPTSLLAHLPGSSMASLSVATTNETAFSAGDWATKFTARDTAVSGTVTTSP